MVRVFVGSKALATVAGDANLFGINTTGETKLYPRATKDIAELGTGIGWMDAERTKQAIHGRIRYITPADYAADADEAITPAERVVRLQAAMDYAAANGYDLAIPKANESYKIDAPLYATRNIPLNVYLNGTLENVNTTFGNDRQAIIKFGNFHPALLGAYPAFECDTPTIPSDRVVLTGTGTNRSDAAAAIPVGSQVFVFSKHHYLGAGANVNRQRSSYFLLANVLAVDAITGVVILDRSLTEIPPGGVLIANSYQPGILDTYSKPSFVTRNFRVIGEGGFISPQWGGRAGLLDCKIELAFVNSKEGIWLNLMANSSAHFDRMTVTRKILEAAGMSHDSLFSFGHADFIGTGEVEEGNAVNMMVFGENSRNITVKGDTVDADSYNVSSALFFNACRQCKVDINRLYTPSITQTVVSFSNPAQPVTGNQVQAPTYDNSVRFGHVYANAPARFIWSTNEGGENKRNRVETGKFIGTSTVYPVAIDGGEDFYVGPIEVTAGALRFSGATTIRPIAKGGYFPLGVSVSPTVINAMTSDIRSDASVLLRSITKTYVGNDISSETTSGSDYLVVEIPPGTFQIGNGIEFYIEGTVAGTAGVKTIQITDDTGVIGTATFIASENGGFSLRGKILTQTLGVYSTTFTGHRNNLPSQQINIRRGGLSLGTVSRTITFERWVANAADSITIYAYGIKPIWPGYDLG